MRNARYRIRAHAKLNLGLKIIGRRADGYHELRTVFQTITLADRVEVDIAPRRRGMTDAITLETTGLEAPAGADNLAYRAAALGAEAFGVRGAIHIRVHKRIPLGAGLGGGSADAAAVLRALAAYAAEAAPHPPAWRTRLDAAAQLGSDVPALMLGGTVLGLGRGEEVYPLPDVRPWPGLVVLPALGAHTAISTAEAFARWDGSHKLTHPLTTDAASDTMMRFCSLLWQVLPAFSPSGANRGRIHAGGPALDGPRVHAGIENDFQPGVFSLSPDFPRIHRQLCRRQAFWVSLSGSGAAQYGLFREAARAQAAAAGFSRDRVWSVRCVGRRAFARGLVAI